MDLPKQIIELVPTTEARATLLAEIDALTKSVYQTEGSFDKTLESGVRSEIKTVISAVTKQDQTPKQKEATLTALRDAVLALPLLHMTLAFEPSARGIAAFSEKARSYFGPDVVLDIVVDPALFGGAQISYNGRYTDLSLAAKMETYFAKEHR